MSPGIMTGVGGASLDWDRRRRVTPVQTASQEAWPEADLGDEILSEMRAVVERRQACALQKGARRIARCGGCYPAFAGVPLPSFYWLIGRNGLNGRPKDRHHPCPFLEPDRFRARRDHVSASARSICASRGKTRAP